MKNVFQKLLLISFLVLWGVKSNAEEMYYYSGVLLHEKCGGSTEKNEYDPEVLKILEGYIISSEVVDENGNKKLARKSLLEPFNKEGYGDRVFNFEKLRDDIIETEDSDIKECLRALYRRGLMEWQAYLNKLSQDYGCGLELQSADYACGYLKEKNTFTCSSDKKEVSTIDENNYNYEMEVYGIGGEGESYNKETCAKTAQDEDLREIIKQQMKYLEELNDGFMDKEAKIHATAMSKDKKTSETAAGICTDPRGCGEKSAEGKSVQLSKEAQEKACCDSIGENWTSLGFSTMAGAKPSDKNCKDMIDKEKDKGALDTVGQCLINVIGSFTKGAIDGVKSFFSLFQAGWISSIGTLINELKNDPTGTAMKILKDMAGYDEEILSCVNDHTKKELLCAMFGKFAGGNFGFGLGVGAVGTLLGKTAKIATKLRPDSKLIKAMGVDKLASSPLAGKGALKYAAKQAFKVSTLWPATAAIGVAKAGSWAIRRSNLKQAAKFTVTAPLKVAAATTTAAAGVAAKGASKAFGGNAHLARGFSEMSESAFALTKEQFSSIIGKSKSKLAGDIKSLEIQNRSKISEINILKKNFEAETKNMPMVNGKPKGKPDQLAKAMSLQEQIVNKQKELGVGVERLNSAKIEFYKKTVEAEQRAVLTSNTAKISELKKSRVLTDSQKAEISALEKQNLQIRQDLSNLAKASKEQLSTRLVNAGLISGTAVGTSANQNNTSSGKMNEKNKPSVEGGANEVSTPEVKDPNQNEAPKVEAEKNPKPEEAMAEDKKPANDSKKEPVQEQKVGPPPQD